MIFSLINNQLTFDLLNFIYLNCIVYSITSEKENTVCLGATISRMPDPTSITNTTELYVNGEQIISKGVVAGNTNFSQWFDWTEYYVGCIKLNKGDNEIIWLIYLKIW